MRYADAPISRADTAQPSMHAFTATDVPALVELLSRAWRPDPVTESWFINRVLVDPRFDPAGLLVAEVAGRVVGAALAIAVVDAAPGVEAGTGWIPFLAVDPDLRGAGMGAALLQGSLRFLRDRGMTGVTVGAYPPAYIIPGIDLDEGDAASRLLSRAGFRVIERPVGMRRSLVGHPVEPSAPHGGPTDIGYRFRPAVPGDLPELLHLASRLGADWAQVLQESAMRFGAPLRFQLAIAPDDAIAGFAAFGSYEGDLSRFGPFGVDPAHRGQSLGRLLLDSTLAAMHERGAREAWFLWSDPDNAAGRLYGRAGFRPHRRFAILHRPLLPETSGTRA